MILDYHICRISRVRMNIFLYLLIYVCISLGLVYCGDSERKVDVDPAEFDWRGGEVY